MIKIMHFIHGLNMGGAETLVKEYALGLDKQKFKVTVLCLERLDSPWDQLLSQAGIHVIYTCDDMPLYGKKSIIAKIINRLMQYWLVRKYIRLVEPDIIHEHVVLSRYVCFAKPKKETIIFYTQHFQVDRLQKDFSGDIKATKWLMHHYIVKMIALNNDMKAELKNVLKTSDIAVLNNGINVKRFMESKSRRSIRQELEIPEKSFVIGHVGRFDPIKNHKFLVSIFAEVIKQKQDAFLLLVGQGETKFAVLKQLQQLDLEKKALILSDRVDIPDLMHAMDVMVLPSFSEGMPVTLVEAQIAGLGCLVSDSVPQAIKISNLIEYFSLDKPIAEWAKKIVNWEKREPVYQKIDQWDINKIIKRLEELYEESMRQTGNY